MSFDKVLSLNLVPFSEIDPGEFFGIAWDCHPMTESYDPWHWVYLCQKLSDGDGHRFIWIAEDDSVELSVDTDIQVHRYEDVNNSNPAPPPKRRVLPDEAELLAGAEGLALDIKEFLQLAARTDQGRDEFTLANVRSELCDACQEMVEALAKAETAHIRAVKDPTLNFTRIVGFVTTYTGLFDRGYDVVGGLETGIISLDERASFSPRLILSPDPILEGRLTEALQGPDPFELSRVGIDAGYVSQLLANLENSNVAYRKIREAIIQLKNLDIQLNPLGLGELTATSENPAGAC